jgi:hypothetical protein
MRTLLIESLPGCGRAVEDRLRGAGHDVLRCHAPHEPTFPCRALTTGCPLEEPAGIDSVVAVRTPTEPDQAVSEMGITCALRRSVPVVVVGESHLDPFGDRVQRGEEDEVLDRCARAIDDAREEVLAPLRAEARRLVARAGGDPMVTDVAIEHEPRRTRIEVTLPPCEEDIRETVASHVLSRYQPPAGPDRTIDIEITRPQEER